MAEASDAPEVRILLLGDADCGKTTFLSRISLGSSAGKGRLTLPVLKDINQPFVYDIKLYNRPYRFEFSDNSSPTSWSLLHPDVVVLCYDISQRLSLINVQRVPSQPHIYKRTQRQVDALSDQNQWSKAPKQHFANAANIPILLLGLKRDLRSEDDPNGIIYPQEGYRIAQELRCDRYLECSAVTGELMGEVWEDICRTAAKTTHGEGDGLSEGGCNVM